MVRILSLDDDPAMLILLRLILESAGYEFLGATDEEVALSIMRTQPIDLFTQDFTRSGLGGCEFLRQMKSDEALSTIPVLGISAGNKDTHAEQLRQIGLDIDRDLDGYIQKPFTMVELLEAIEAILIKHGKSVPPQANEVCKRLGMQRRA